jgi:hypothetical protein
MAKKILAGMILSGGCLPLAMGFSVMNRTLLFLVWIRRALGAAVMMGVLTIAIVWDALAHT